MAEFLVSMAVEVPDDGALEADDVEVELQRLADANGWTVTSLAVVAA
jgi:hypothetical protein